MEEEQRGVVKWFDVEKNYGFIISDDGQEIFVHKSGVLDGNNLEKGLRVKFKIGESNKGPIAVDVVEYSEV